MPRQGTRLERRCLAAHSRGPPNCLHFSRRFTLHSILGGNPPGSTASVHSPFRRVAGESVASTPGASSRSTNFQRNHRCRVKTRLVFAGGSASVQFRALINPRFPAHFRGNQRALVPSDPLGVRARHAAQILGRLPLSKPRQALAMHRQQARMVAPVVTTSSTTTTVRPARERHHSP